MPVWCEAGAAIVSNGKHRWLWVPGFAGTTRESSHPSSPAAILIRRDLDQAAVGVAAVHRAQRAAGALFGHRAFFDRRAACVEMRDYLFRRARGEKAQIVTPRGFMVRGEPLDLVGTKRSHIDFLVAEDQRGPRRLAGTRIEYPDLHAEDFPIPLGGARHVGDIDDEMIERVNLDRHALSFRRGRGADARLAASDFVCYNAARSSIQQERTAYHRSVRQGETAWLHVAPRFV